VAALPHLGNRRRLDQQEAVRAGHLGLLSGDGLVAAPRSGRLDLVLVVIVIVIVAGSDPVAQYGLEVGLDVVWIGLLFIFVLVATSRLGTRFVLVLSVVGVAFLFGFLVVGDLTVAALRAFALGIAILVLAGLMVLGCFLVAHCFLRSVTLVAAGS
jgi:hypothetical protein